MGSHAKLSRTTSSTPVRAKVHAQDVEVQRPPSPVTADGSLGHRFDQVAVRAHRPNGSPPTGRPLPEALRQRMEKSFGETFSGVHLHENSDPRSLGADAYAQGEEIHLAPGQLRPHEPETLELLGHELAHVVQQRAGRVRAPLGAGAPVNVDARLEAEAAEAGARAAQGEPATVQQAGAGQPLPAAVMQPGKKKRPRKGLYNSRRRLKKSSAYRPDKKSKADPIVLRRKSPRNLVQQPASASESADLSSMYDYDSDALENMSGLESDDADDPITVKRQNGKKLPVPVFSLKKGMHRTARSIRRLRKNESTDKEKHPIAVNLIGGPVELTPNKVYRDVGAYPLQRTESGSFMRAGKATPYAKLGSRLDTAANSADLPFQALNSSLQNTLLDQPLPHPLSATAREHVNETASVLLTDMARGSAGPSLVSETLRDNSSFTSRFKQGGNYKPASSGGSNFIQERTKERTKRFKAAASKTAEHKEEEMKDE